MIWDTKTIDQVCLPIAQENARARQKQQSKYVDTSSIDGSRNVVISSKEIAGSEKPNQSLHEIREGDILVSTIRPHLNIVAIVPPELDGQAASADLCILRPNTEFIERRYLFHFTTSKQFASLLARKARPGSLSRVSEREIKQIELPLPALFEQRKIAEILDEANELRINSMKAGEKYFRIVLAMFYKDFGDPAINPKGWRTMSLEEISAESLQSGINAKVTHWTDGMPRYVRSSDLTSEGRLNSFDVVSLEMDNWITYQLIPGDILFATSGHVGRTYMHHRQDGICVFERNLVRVKLNSEYVIPWYVFAITKTDYFKRYIEIRKSPSNVPHIRLKELSNLKVPIPPIPRQKEFAKVIGNLSEIHNKQAVLEEKIQRIYNITLQHGFSGKLTENSRKFQPMQLKDDVEALAATHNSISK